MAGRYGYSRRTSEYREHWWSFVDWFPVLSVIGGVVIAGLVIWLVLLGVQEQERWEQWCYGQGGHVDKNTRLGYGSVDGKQVTTTNPTYYCLTEDGPAQNGRETGGERVGKGG